MERKEREIGPDHRGQIYDSEKFVGIARLSKIVCARSSESPWLGRRDFQPWVSRMCLTVTFLVSASLSGSPFTDDNLSTKKLLPGHMFRVNQKLKNTKWANYGTVSAEATALCMAFVISTFRAAPEKMRKKLTKQEMDEAVEMCLLPTMRMVTAITMFLCFVFLNHYLLNKLRCSGAVAIGLRDELSRSVPGIDAALDQCPVWISFHAAISLSL